MPDEMDRVQDAIERHQTDSLDAWRRRQPKGSGPTHCINCEEPIPEKRRLALPGVETCIDCQRALERGARR